MKRLALILVPVGSLVCSCSAPEPANKYEADGVAAATAWIELTDRAQYEQSWERAAKRFRERVTREAWVEQLRTMRLALGPVAARRLTSIESTSRVPGAPDAQYVVLAYETAFSNKGDAATETVTVMRESDSAWRVVGYRIE